MWRFCWHDWTPWRTYVWRGFQYGMRGYLLTGDTRPIEVTRTNQARRCRKCGKEIHRTIADACGSIMPDMKEDKYGNRT